MRKIWLIILFLLTMKSIIYSQDKIKSKSLDLSENGISTISNLDIDSNYLYFSANRGDDLDNAKYWSLCKYDLPNGSLKKVKFPHIRITKMFRILYSSKYALLFGNKRIVVFKKKTLSIERLLDYSYGFIESFGYNQVWGMEDKANGKEYFCFTFERNPTAYLPVEQRVPLNNSLVRIIIDENFKEIYVGYYLYFPIVYNDNIYYGYKEKNSLLIKKKSIENRKVSIWRKFSNFFDKSQEAIPIDVYLTGNNTLLAKTFTKIAICNLTDMSSKIFEIKIGQSISDSKGNIYRIFDNRLFVIGSKFQEIKRKLNIPSSDECSIKQLTQNMVLYTFNPEKNRLIRILERDNEYYILPKLKGMRSNHYIKANDKYFCYYNGCDKIYIVSLKELIEKSKRIQ